MKKIYTALKIALCCVVALFLGLSAYTCYDYITNPEPYEYTSGPWYLGIEIYGILALFLVIVILIPMLLVKRKIKKMNK